MAGKRTRSIIQFIILLGIGVLLIWLSLKDITPEQRDKIIVAFQTADYFWITLAMLVACFSHFLRAYRWNYLLEPLGYKVDLLNANCHVLIGYFANYGIPRMGEITRCTLASRYDKVPFEVALGTVITERIIDFILFLVIFVLTLLVQFNELIGLANKFVFDPLLSKLSGIGQSPVKLAVVAIVIAALVILFFVLRKKFSALLKGKLGGVLKGMGEGIGSVRKMKNPIRFLILSIMIWASYFYALYFCLFALPGTAHLGQGACLTLMLFGTFGVIFAPGGLGAYPAIISWILTSTYAIDVVSAFALPWLSWTGQFILLLVLFVAGLIILPLYNRNRNVVSPAA